MANNGTVINVSSACCIVILHKGAITVVILIYDLNARDSFHGDAKFSTNFAWDAEFPVQWGIPKALRGFQNS